MIHALRLSAAALALSALIPTTASAQTVLTMSSWVPPSHSLTVALAQWGADLEKATNGRIKVQMLPKHPAAAPGTFDAVRDGLVDVSYVTASYTPARHILPKMPELPGGGATAEINSVAYWRIHNKHFEKAGEYKGVRLLGVFTHGPGQMFNTKKPIDSVDDLAGMKIRNGGGIADGVFFPLESIASFKLDRVIKYATLFPGGFYGSAFGFFMNEDKFNKLPKQDQDIIVSMGGEPLARRFGKSWDEADRKAFEVMKAANIKILDATPELIKGVQQRAATIEQDWIKAATEKRGVDGAKVLAEFRQELKNVAAGK